MPNPKPALIVQHPLLKVARIAVETYVRDHVIMPVPFSLPADQAQPQGAFVSIIIHKNLRGSVGTVRPTQPTLAGEVIHNAVAAAVRDPRFSPVRAEELVDLNYIIDLVDDLERIDDKTQLDPTQYGVVVRSGRKLGVVLPQTSDISTVEAQITLALHKAGIDPAEHYHLERFCVQRLVAASGDYQQTVSKKIE
jgi:AmmeMemoRadiSam system protein A